jgi:hypothetical protein
VLRSLVYTARLSITLIYFYNRNKRTNLFWKILSGAPFNFFDNEDMYLLTGEYWLNNMNSNSYSLAIWYGWLRVADMPHLRVISSTYRKHRPSIINAIYSFKPYGSRSNMYRSSNLLIRSSPSYRFDISINICIIITLNTRNLTYKN